MSGRPTIKSIEPYVYTLYMLVLHDNISLERALKMYDDDHKFYNEKTQYVSNKEYIQGGIHKHLTNFWAAQGLLRHSNASEIIEFIKKNLNESHNMGVFSRIGNWFKTHLPFGPPV